LYPVRGILAERRVGLETQGSASLPLTSRMLARLI
jgi:hypothetical protein